MNCWRATISQKGHKVDNINPAKILLYVILIHQVSN